MNYLTLLLALSSTLSFASSYHASTYDDHVKFLNKTKIFGHDIAYIDEGPRDATPVVLMHGIPTNSWMYRGVIQGLLHQGFRVVAPDLLGLGQSQRPRKKKEVRVHSQAKYMKSLLLDHLELQNWIHVVHDFAGPITWEMMEDQRFNPAHLVVLDTMAFKDGFRPGLSIFTRAGMGIMTTRPFRKGFYRSMIKRMIQNKKSASKPMLDGYVRSLHAGQSRTYKAMYFRAKKIRRQFPRYQQTLESKAPPATIIWGENDPFLSAKKQMPQFKNILGVPDERTHILAGTKHLIAEEAPEKIVEIISEIELPDMIEASTQPMRIECIFEADPDEQPYTSALP